MQVKSGKTYVGVVEDCEDPKKIGRVKVRVFDVFDDVPIEDLPWANPWKDLAGNGFAVPEKGKVVTVVFENGDQNSPEFISSDHYNINLEKKLSGLGTGDYLTMKSLIFDHRTQVYVNEGEGLKLDHKFNMINIKESSINVNLKDNFAKINLGTANSTQRAILGDNFLNWFDDFVQILMGSKGGPFLGNLGAPVVATPALLGSLQLYQQLKDPKFLSKNVYIVDNENVAKLDRIAEGQKGDTWQSTVKDNDMTSKEPVPYTPTSGSSDTTFDQPPMDTPIASTQSIPVEAPKPKPAENPDAKIIEELMKIKSYVLSTEVNKLNIVAIRNQCLSPGDKYTDQFGDKLYIMYKKEDDSWDVKHYLFSTVPGLEFTITDSWLTEKNLKNVKPWIDSVGKKIFMKDYVKIAGSENGDPVLKSGLPVLAPSQYIDTYYVSEYKGAKAMKVTPGASQLVWRDLDFSNPDTFNPSNLTAPESITPNDLVDNGIKIHLGYPGGVNVGSWSEGSQVFPTSDSLNEFFQHCEKHKEKYGNKFTYTLATKNDWDQATKNVGADKASDPLGNTQSAVDVAADTPGTTQSTATQSQSQEMVEKNKSEVIDVLGDGSLMIDVYVPKTIISGKMTTDDIKSLSNDDIKFSIKSQSIPGEWQFITSDVSYNAPNGAGTGQQVTSLNSTEATYNIISEQYIETGNDDSIGSYKISISITMNKKSNNEQKSVKKEIEFSLEKGSPSTSSSSSAGSTNEYIIGILNPTTANSKKVNGKITFTKRGPMKSATGFISGFPDGGQIGPLEGQESATSDETSLLESMLRTLEESIITKYNVGIKLVVVEKK
jgi:hypothetical protein